MTADPVSYLLIERGWEVVGADDELLADVDADIFDGLTVDQGLTKRPRYVPSERVAQIVDGRVTLDAAAERFEDEFPEWTGTPPG